MSDAPGWFVIVGVTVWCLALALACATEHVWNPPADEDER